MSWVAVGAAAVAATVATVKIGKGIHDTNKAKKMEKALGKRPTYVPNKYEIPDAMLEAEKRSKFMALDTMFAGQKRAEEKIGQATATGIQALKETARTPSELLATTSAVVGNEQEQFANMGEIAAQDKARREQAVTAVLGQKAGFEDEKTRFEAAEKNKAFQWNVADPYLAAVQAIREKRKAGEQTTMSGINDMGGIGTSMASSGMFSGKSGQNKTNPPYQAPASTGTPSTLPYENQPMDWNKYYFNNPQSEAQILKTKAASGTLTESDKIRLKELMGAGH